MNTSIKASGFLAVILLFVSGCKLQGAQVQDEEGALPKAPAYQTLLGKPLNDAVIVNFIASNNCSPAEKFQLCQEVGMALWIGSDQIVKTVWLYSGHADGFRRYRGELPFGLTFYDPMWRVEEKLSNLDAGETDQPAAEVGLPNEGLSPDHFHYWAVYERFGITVIYDAPFADEDAYIYAVVVQV